MEHNSKSELHDTAVRSKAHADRDREFFLDGSYDYYTKSKSRKYRAYKYRIPALSK